MVAQLETSKGDFAGPHSGLIKRGISMGAKEFREMQATWDGVAAGFDEYITPLTISFAEAALQRGSGRMAVRQPRSVWKTGIH